MRLEAVRRRGKGLGMERFAAPDARGQRLDGGPVEENGEVDEEEEEHRNDDCACPAAVYRAATVP